MLKKESVKQFIKFAIVGVTNTLINLSVLYVLKEFFGVYYLFAAVIAFIVAVTNSFILNKIWTFKENIRDGTIKKYSKFFMVSLSALLVNLLILYILTDIFKLYYMLSQIVAIGVSLWINFFGNKTWTFRR